MILQCIPLMHNYKQGSAALPEGPAMQPMTDGKKMETCKRVGKACNPKTRIILRCGLGYRYRVLALLLKLCGYVSEGPVARERARR